jgi:hypothetical protein
MALVRHILRNVKVGTQSNETTSAPQTWFKGIEEAIQAAQKTTKQQDTEYLLRCIDIWIERRLFIRENSDDNGVSDEVHAFVKKRGAKNLEYIGYRAISIAYAISPHSFLGVLLLPIMGLSADQLREAKEGELATLAGAFACKGSSHPRDNLAALGFEADFIPVIEFFVEQYVPAMVCILYENRDFYYGQLCKRFQSLVAPADVGEMDLVFKIGEKKISMPSRHLMDRYYRTNDPGKKLEIVKFFKKKIHISADRHEKKYGKYPLGGHTIEQIERYMSYWKLPFVTSRGSAEVYPGRPVKPTSLPDPDERWEQLDTALCFWVAIVHGASHEGIKCLAPGKKTIYVKVHPNDAAFFGVLSTKHLDEMEAEDDEMEVHQDDVSMITGWESGEGSSDGDDGDEIDGA